MKNHPANWLVPAGVVGAVLIVLVGAAISAGSAGEGMNLYEFSRLPVLDGGRVKPMGTYARVNLKIINNGQESFRDENGNSHSAIEWVADVISNKPGQRTAPRNPHFNPHDDPHGDQTPPIALQYRVFRIDNEQVLGLLELQPRGGLRYSISEFVNHIDDISKQASISVKKEHKDLFDHKIVELAKHLETYMHVMQASETLHCIPVRQGVTVDWWSLRDAVKNAGPEKDIKDINPGARSYAGILAAYQKGDVTGFNRALADYRSYVDSVVGGETSKPRFEEYFNAFSPFVWGCIFYGIAFLMALTSFLGWTIPLRRGAFWLCAITFALHTVALVGRMYIQGRPPVTNLYASAIFIGWGAVAACLVLEMLYPLGIANVVGNVGGFLSLLVAYFLSTDGDTMPVLQAVLDTNFWLWTHVTCVTFGYTATFVAGFLGIGYLALGIVNLLFPLPSSVLDKSVTKSLGTMIYAIVCFGLFFSFVGTVLGGLWADYSWGRFWGWDPKENGALMIVIWNGIILHARWGGMVKSRGIATLAVGGNIVTAWSWFGVNMLGVGLHSYGFMGGAVFWLSVFCLSQAGLMLAEALMPASAWVSINPPRGPRAIVPSSTSIRPGTAGA